MCCEVEGTDSLPREPSRGWFSAFGAADRTVGFSRIKSMDEGFKGTKVNIEVEAAGWISWIKRLPGRWFCGGECFVVVKPYPVEKEVKETKLITKRTMVVVVRMKRFLLRRRFLFEMENVEMTLSFNILGRRSVRKATPPRAKNTYVKRFRVGINRHPG